MPIGLATSFRRLAPTAVKRVRRFVIDVEDSHALAALAPLSDVFLPWTMFSMRPTAILAIVNDIVINRRAVIVECGSGNSTIIAARALAQHRIDGCIYSIEHDPEWAALIAGALARENLEQWASVTCAPLVDGWYDRRRLPEVDGIGLLVVDGPPTYRPEIETARRPALSAFCDRLVAGAVILLDDARRRGEQRVISAWRKDYGLEFKHEPGGYATATWNPKTAGSVLGGFSSSR